MFPHPVPVCLQALSPVTRVRASRWDLSPPGDANLCVCVCVLRRRDPAAPRSPTEAQMGADVEADCREGTDEHAVHLSGRPGNVGQIRGTAPTSNCDVSTKNNIHIFLDFYHNQTMKLVQVSLQEPHVYPTPIVRRW